MVYKKLKKGDLFKCYGSSAEDDLRIFKAISSHVVENIGSSNYQIKMDSMHRNRKENQVFTSDIEPNWYKKRGFIFIDGVK